MERASGIRGSIQQGSLLVGAPIGGVLVAELGATTALWLDAASFLVSAALVVGFVPRPHAADAEAPRGRVFGELADGLRFIWRRPLVKALLLMVLLTNLVEAPGTVVLAVFAASLTRRSPALPSRPGPRATGRCAGCWFRRS